MSTDAPHPVSPEAMDEFNRLCRLINTTQAAQMIWTRAFSEAEREQLGGNLEQSYARNLNWGAWSIVRGVSGERAAIEIAYFLGFTNETKRDWLLREFDEVSSDVEALIDAAQAAGHFVLVEQPREVYWQSEKVDIDWDRRDRLWSFLVRLAERGKVGAGVDRLDFGENVASNYVNDQKHKLTSQVKFPLTLADRIVRCGHGQQRLDLPPGQIRLFQLNLHGLLEETTGARSV